MDRAGIFDLLYAGLVLSVPFMLGVVAGRGFKRSADDGADVGTKAIATMTREVYDKARFVATDDFRISVTKELVIEGKPTVYLILSTHRMS